MCDTDYNIKNKCSVNSNAIGLDLGLKDFLTTSNGDKIYNPQFLKNNISKLNYIQSRYSRFKGKRTKHKLALLHEKIASQRKDFLNKTSSYFIKNHDNIAIEDLNIKGLIKNRKLSKSIMDVGWGMFIEMLKYKENWNGNNLLIINRFDPSSKTCSSCGYIYNELSLKNREWECVECNSIHDRDVNAAINIKTFALNKYLYTEHIHKNHNELSSIEEVLTYEARDYELFTPPRIGG